MLPGCPFAGPLARTSRRLLGRFPSAPPGVRGFPAREARLIRGAWNARGGHGSPGCIWKGELAGSHPLTTLREPDLGVRKTLIYLLFKIQSFPGQHLAHQGFAGLDLGSWRPPLLGAPHRRTAQGSASLLAETTLVT